MKMKNVVVFFLSVFLFIPVSCHRFGDSGHAITMISQSGGRFRHPVHIDKNYGRCALIVTGTVVPPYRGDARVVLESPDRLTHSVYFSKPVIDFGFTNLPFFENNILYGLKPGDRISLWILIENIFREKESKCHLALYDTKTNKPVLKLPILFEGAQKEAGDEKIE